MQKLITNTERFCSLILKNYQQSIPFSLKSQLITFRSYLETFQYGKQTYLESYIDRLEKEYQMHSYHLQTNPFQQSYSRSTNNLKMKTEVCQESTNSNNFNDSYKISDYAYSSIDALSKANNKGHSHDSRHSSANQSINETLFVTNDENINIGNLHPQGILFKRMSDNDHFLGASLGHDYKKNKRNSHRSGDIGIAASVGSNNIKSLKIILKPKTNTNFVNKPNPTQKYNSTDKFSKRPLNESCDKKESQRSELNQGSLILKSKQSIESGRNGKFFETANIPKPLKSARSTNRGKQSFYNKETLGLMRGNIESLLKLYDQNYSLVKVYEDHQMNYQSWKNEQLKGLKTFR